MIVSIIQAWIICRKQVCALGSSQGPGISSRHKGTFWARKWGQSAALSSAAHLDPYWIHLLEGLSLSPAIYRYTDYHQLAPGRAPCMCTSTQSVNSFCFLLPPSSPALLRPPSFLHMSLHLGFTFESSILSHFLLGILMIYLESTRTC